ncbi:hypothetical protein COE51_01120 [Bacillus pseudomycoides]|nr:hypothetical protein COE51_01120 [Bacillus pseudomycoides]
MLKTGIELKIKRIELGLQAREIAEILDVSKSYISKMEREAQGIPEHIYDKWIKVLEIK